MSETTKLTQAATTDWLTPEERHEMLPRPGLSKSINSQGILAYVIERFAAHAAEADRRLAALEAERDRLNTLAEEQDRCIGENLAELRRLDAEMAERDDVIRELAGALRRLDLRHMLGDEPSEKQAKTDGLAALARVDALDGMR